MTVQSKPARTVLAALVLFLSVIVAADGALSGGAWRGQEPGAAAYERLAQHILQTGLMELGAYSTLAKLLSAGPRLTGSAEAAAAVALMADHMKGLGFDNVRTEPTTVSHWVRGAREEGAVVSSSGARLPVNVRAIGNSIATPPDGLEAGVVEVHSVAEVGKIGDGARGRIVFFNGAMDPALLDTFAAYGGAAQQRSGGAAAAARAGAVGVVVRSLTLEQDDDPHTGTMSYDAAVPKIPAVTISTKGAQLLGERLRSEPNLRFWFRTSSRALAPVTAHNVMGELRGSEKPDDVIVVGAHIDSWDLSPGAHDDGAGCAQSIEALRLLRELGLRPKRTIRAVLFMDEENGGTGGRAYARSPNREGERHIAAIESDRGGFLPLGIGAGSRGPAFERVRAWEPLFQLIGLQWVRPGGGGVDIAPLAAGGTVMMGLIPDSQRYFDVHHSGTDTIEAVHPRELELGATAMALLAYLLAQEGLPR